MGSFKATKILLDRILWRNALSMKKQLPQSNINYRFYSEFAISGSRYRSTTSKPAVPIIPTTEQPEGFRAIDKPVKKPSAKREDPRLFVPFSTINHQRAKVKKSQFDATEEFSISTIWTPLVPLCVIGVGIYIIVSGVMTNPPGDDDD